MSPGAIELICVSLTARSSQNSFVKEKVRLCLKNCTFVHLRHSENKDFNQDIFKNQFQVFQSKSIKFPNFRSGVFKKIFLF